MNRRLLIGLACLLVLALSACGLSSGVVLSAESLLREMNQAERDIATRTGEVDAAINAASTETLKSGIRNEGFDGILQTLKTRLDAAQATYKAKIQPLLDANDSAGEEKLINEQTQLRTEVRAISNALAAIPDQLTEIQRVAENAPGLADEMDRYQERAQQAWKQFNTVAAGAKKDFPEKAADVDAQLANVGNKIKEIDTAYTEGKAEYAKISAGQPADLMGFANAHQTVVDTGNSVIDQIRDQGGRFLALGQAYAKTLIDMKAEYAITPKRQSWDESQEYPSIHNYDYQPRQVTAEVFDYFDDLTVDPLGTYSEGWFSSGFQLSGGVDQARWDTLKIDPKEQLSSGDNAAEYWIDKFEPSYFHKYRVIRDTQTAETDWEQVPPEFYAEHIDHLGMDIEAKPYGAFPEERLTQATPHGLAFVGNPRYGRWESDGSGGRVWHWLAAYAFFSTVFGPSPYYYPYSSWNTWNTGYRGRQPYYGECGPNGQPCYGTYGTYVGRSTYYSSSSFGRSGGFSRPPASVRGAGSRSRGGGFGGSGK